MASLDEADGASLEPAPEAGTPATPQPPPAPPSAPRPSVWAQAVQRRVPQILGLYAGGATSAVLFTEFLVQRYALSPYLVDALLLTIVLALPAVALLAYGHGAPGAQRWTRAQALALGANGALAAVVLGLLFWGKPLGATTETVTVETADGETVERTIARAAFRRRLVVSDFEGDEALGRTAGRVLAADLNQDLFVAAYSSEAMRRALRESGFRTTAGAPAALLREAATDVRADRLVTGTVEQTPQGVRLTADVVATEGPRRAQRYEVEGPSFVRAVDDLSTRIRDDLGLPETHLAEADDRPVEDILSGSTDALVAFSNGLHAATFDDDLEAAAGHYAEATAIDTTFALAHLMRGNALIRLAREAEGLRAFAAASRHRYRLIESWRFGLDASQAIYQQRPDDAVATVREWTALYPDDIDAFEMLAGLLQFRDDTEGAIQARQRIVELDAANPDRRYQLARLYLTAERFDEALVEIDAYVAADPEDAAGHSLRASVRRSQGDLDGAEAAVRQAIRLDPTDIRYGLYLGSLQVFTGAWDEAEATYRQAADRATEARDRVQALSGIAHLYETLGRRVEAAETLDAMWPVMATFTTATDLLIYRLNEGYHYTQAGRTDVFEATLADALARPEIRNSDIFRASIAMASAYAYAQTGETQPVFEAVATGDSLLQAYGQNAAVPTVRAFRGLGHANAGDWEAAIRDLEPFVARNPTDARRATDLAEAYLAANAPDQARETAAATLRIFPAFPRAHLVLARLSRGDEARRHLDAALEAWADADPDFEPAREARALRAAL